MRAKAAALTAKERKAQFEGEKQVFMERICRLYLNMFRMQNTIKLAKLNRGVNFDNHRHQRSLSRGS